MDFDIKNLPNNELLELYKSIKDFENFLEKEYKNTEKMRDTNE